MVIDFWKFQQSLGEVPFEMLSPHHFFFLWKEQLLDQLTQHYCIFCKH